MYQEIRIFKMILYKLVLIKITIQKNKIQIDTIKFHFTHLCQNKKVQEKQIFQFKIPSLIQPI